MTTTKSTTCKCGLSNPHTGKCRPRPVPVTNANDESIKIRMNAILDNQKHSNVSIPFTCNQQYAIGVQGHEDTFERKGSTGTSGKDLTVKGDRRRIVEMAKEEGRQEERKKMKKHILASKIIR